MSQRRNRRQYNKALSRAKNIVRGAIANNTTDLATFILDTTKIVPSADVPTFLRWIEHYPAQKKRIRPPRLCTEYADLWPRRSSMPLIDSFPMSIQWVHSFLSNNCDIVTQYISLLNDYENFLLSDELSSALRMVEMIDKELGFSIWAIETRIALLQRLGGLEAQKRYTATIRESAPDSLPAFIASYTSERNEPNISFSRFSRKMERHIARQNTSEHLKKYITRRLLGLKGDDIAVEDISHVMGVAGSLSIIDAYEGFVWACQTAVEKGLAEKYYRTISVSLSDLDVADWRVSKLKAYISSDFSNIPLRQLAAETHLYQGKFADAFQQSLTQLELTPHDIDNVVNASAALSYGELSAVDLQRTKISSELVLLLSKVITKDDGVASAANDLIKLVLNFRSLRSIAAIYGYLVIEWGESLQIGESEGTSIFLSSPFLNPSHWSVLSSTAASSMLKRIGEERPSCLVTEMCTSLAKGDNVELENVAKEISLLQQARSAIYMGQHTRASTILVALGRSDDPMWRRVAAKMDIHCLLATSNIEQSIDRTVQYCCQQDDLRFIFPLRSILGGVRWKHVKHLKAKIQTPIIFDLYWRTVDEVEHETNRRIAYDEFLLAHNCRKPTALRAIAGQFQASQLIYFLGTVCVQEVMDVSFDVFDSSREIEEERIAICQWLTELGTDSKAAYLEEIVELTKLINIQDGLRDVDRSRVHVDIEAIARWARKEVKESYARYKALVGAGIGFGTPEDLEDALVKFAVGDKHAVVDYLTYPDHEGDSLLLDMLESLTSEYLSNSDYGLDAYLSMRIRHGSLSGHLRGPLEEQSLIVAKDGNSDKYGQNTTCLSMKVRSPMPCSCSCLSPTRSQRRRRELHGADSDMAQRLETAMAHTLRLGSLAELHG